MAMARRLLFLPPNRPATKRPIHKSTEATVSHLSGHCSCGQRIHFPKYFSYGASWNCGKCGRSWVIARHGQPLHTARSKAPPADGGRSTEEPNWVAVVVAGLLILFLIGSCA